MNNFDLKKFLVENKLTKVSNEKITVKEEIDDLFLDAVFDTLNDRMRLGEITRGVFKTAKKYLDEHEIEISLKNENEPEDVADEIIATVETESKNSLKNEMKNNFDLKKFLVENKLTTNSKAVKEGVALPNNPGDPIYVVDEKEVNFDSIELGQFINSNDIAVYVIESAMFIDGTTLDPEQLTDLEGQYFEEEDEDKRIVPADLVREYDMEKTGESIQYEFRTEEGSRVKIGADKLPGYINSLLDKAGNKGVTLTFISKIGLVPDYKITNRTDDMGRPMNQ